MPLWNEYNYRKSTVLTDITIKKKLNQNRYKQVQVQVKNKERRFFSTYNFFC